MSRREKAKRMKKIRTFQRNLHVAAATFVIIAGLALTMSVLRTHAQNSMGGQQPIYKYYTSIVVEYGDSLYSLAEEYASAGNQSIQDYVKEVMHINHMEDETLCSGQYLIIPYYSEEFKKL